MKILLTGANGYIGKRLLPVLLKENHSIYACVRNKSALTLSEDEQNKVKILEVDFLDKKSLKKIPLDFDVAYYLMHSLGSSHAVFSDKEKLLAENFNLILNQSKAKQVIYLGGISNAENLSAHLKSRQNTEQVLQKANTPLTSLRAAIIIGSGGASFEIIRDLVEKLPFMIAPKWLNTKCQPIAIRNVIEYLTACIGNEKSYNKSFDIGGPDVLSYKEMLLQFAEVRGMKRSIWTLPVMSPRLSSYWLYFVTSTAYQIAQNLVDSMKNEVIVKDNSIKEIIPLKLITYRDAVKLAFKRIEQNMVISSWIDSDNFSSIKNDARHYIQVPKNGVFIDKKVVKISPKEFERVHNNIWSIGGERGWYYGNWLWVIRGFIDKMFGGVGLRRGRRNPTDIFTGDSLDFWRVILADSSASRLLLYAEMRLPGEAWLELKIKKDNPYSFVQTATFRPKGIWGRLYWYAMLPFHLFIFKNMAINIVKFKAT